MKALSIKQPWAWLIVHGYKDIENRKWKTNYRGLILIHAGKTIDTEAYRFLAEDYGIPKVEELEVGGVVGEAVIVNCVSTHQSIWFDGPYGFVLKEAKIRPFAPLRGNLGLFDIPEEVLSGV